MPKPLLIAIGFLAPFSGAAWAQDMAGNANFGRKTFKKCQSCHSIIKSDGQYIVKGGKLGPNLYGVIGRTAGTSDFRYGADLIMAGKMGLVWQVDTLSEYLTVRRQGFWHQWGLKLRESLAHLVDCIMRRVVCDASAAFRVYSV